MQALIGQKLGMTQVYDQDGVRVPVTVLESVRDETRRVLEIMKPGGGFVAGASHDSILEETPVENIVAMFDAVKEFGIY